MNLAGIDITEIVAIGILLIALFIGLVWLTLRIENLERRLDDTPTHGDLHRIETQLEAVVGSVRGLNERTDATRSMVASIHQHLLQGGK